MNKRFRQSLLGISLTGLIAIPGFAIAESMQYQCTYTQASYTAPFMKSPSIRNCPEGKCSYHVAVSGSVASINKVAGFTVEQSDTMLKLSRTAKDPVMGGMDTTVFTLNKGDLSFESVKTTTPSVVLTTTGQCTTL